LPKRPTRRVTAVSGRNCATANYSTAADLLQVFASGNSAVCCLSNPMAIHAAVSAQLPLTGVDA
jgi:hypothetical protein